MKTVFLVITPCKVANNKNHNAFDCMEEAETFAALHEGVIIEINYQLN